ncbi:MAG: SpoIID/LytB domain-containing protein [Schaedlerella sp.]|nr:SpoIID/LytB domain-containing protein [Schaedlerella sp.]
MSYRIMQKFKMAGAVLIIIILMPYVMTVCINGVKEDSDSQEIFFSVKVQADESRAVQELAWETYLTGVLAKEISWQEEEEFLKAQAVLIRTKLYQELESGEEKILKEDYLTRQDIEEKLGILDGKAYYEKLKQAVKDTGNQVLFYGDTYAWTPFCYSSNGTTRSAKEVMNTEDYPYLQRKECPLDKGAEEEIRVVTFTYKDIQSRCQSFLVAVAEEDAEKTYQYEDFSIVSYDSAGYVAEMKIGETVCTGDQFRDALGLQSSAFTMKDKSGKLQITTVGRGHGLGLSQWTARKMAEDGKKYDEILQFFFEGTTLASGGEIFTKTE